MRLTQIQKAGKGSIASKWAVVAALLVGVVLPWIFPSNYNIVLLNMALIFTLVVLGLNFVYGFGGIFSLAQAAFWGIGAYTSALLTTDAHMPFLVGLLGALVVTSLFGIVLGVPTLKLRSHYLTMATLGFAEAVQLVLLNADRLTHGAQGVRGIPPASLGPLVFDTPVTSYYLSLAVVAVAILFTRRFLGSRLGRALEATRDDELAAGATGVNVTYCRVLAFVLSAFFAGLAGSLWAHSSSFISPDTFDLFTTIRFVAMLLIGGSGTAMGPVVGSLLLTYLPEWLRFLEAYYMAIYGLSIVLILVFAPRGVVGLLQSLVERMLHNSATDPTSVIATQPDGAASPASSQPLTPIPHPPSPTLLSTRSLTIAFGGLEAVGGVNLSVAPGEIHGI
ncbi:MAG TPA: hypothetical protein VHS28_00005, partial [Chloroflexota bacterium]|nr:hypothetical protein [Chloroflexota bacterium]